MKLGEFLADLLSKSIHASFARIEQGQRNVDARLARVERLLFLLTRATNQEIGTIMALQATDQEVIAEIHRTVDVAKAANLALVTLTGKVTDLTTKLDAAIANSPAADDPAVKAALAELKASNDAQVAATPALAGAIANQDPNVPPPNVNL